MSFKKHRSFPKRQVALLLILAVGVAGAILTPFVAASCRMQQHSAAEVAATVERLRAMTGGDVLPAESVVAGIENGYAGTLAGALARLLHARIKTSANDFPGAAALLNTSDLTRHTALGDYALLMRAQVLEKAGKSIEARAAYEQLARDFPSSLPAREATLRAAELMMQDGQAAAAVPLMLKKLSEKDDAAALLLVARAHEKQGDTTRALGAYRRLYFYAPAALESNEAATAITRLNSTPAAATAAEATSRAEKLFAAKRYEEAFHADTEAVARFPNTATPQATLRRGIAAANARRTTDAIATLNAVRASDEMRAEALHHLAQTYARTKQWEMVRSTIEEMRRASPQSEWTRRALVASGQAAKEAKNVVDASYFWRAAASAFPGHTEVAGAQFELAWLAHEAKNFPESAKLLLVHLAEYADQNTDNRGRAGYWAARDAERAGRTADAYALYQAMQARYDANWYGYLAKQRLETMERHGLKSNTNAAPGSLILRAIENLKLVTIAEETAGPEADERLAKSYQLNAVGLDDWAQAEVDEALKAAPASPRLNLAKARLFRVRGDNVQAFNVLRRSFPDYSQMKPEELTSAEWDIFYPLAHWEIIVQESRARDLDPYLVAGLIRQESVFNTRAVSPARAYGLMQLLVPTGRLVAQRYGVNRAINVESLFEPRLNIQLGTGYLRDNLNKFGRIEYVAAAYNAGPGRAVAWRASLPLEIDEWAEAIPFKETRGYVQGVVRNSMQYRRLYDEQGRFRATVGTRAMRPSASRHDHRRDSPTTQPDDPQGVRPRRVTGDQQEE